MRGERMKHKKKTFNVIIEKDEDGIFIAEVPELKGCHTQAKSLDKLIERVKEAIALCLEEDDGGYDDRHLEFIGIQRIAV